MRAPLARGNGGHLLVLLACVAACSARGPTAAPATAAWPPVDFDAQHWIGPSGSSFRLLTGAGAKPFSEVGCPFQPAPIPRCDWNTLNREEIPEPQSAAFTPDWRPGAIATVQGD